MSHFNNSLKRDALDADSREILTMPAGPPVLLLPLLLENDDLLCPVVLEHGCLDLRVRQKRLSRLEFSIVFNQQDFAKLNSRARIAGQLLEPNRLSWRHAI